MARSIPAPHFSSRQESFVTVWTLNSQVGMSCQSIRIERIVRRMRGGSQAYLIQGSDRKFYVAKFVGNPQGTRTLINEWIATRLFRRCGITTPDLVLLLLRPSTKWMGPVFEIGNRSHPVPAGHHLGSLCPLNPDKEAIYDFLPAHLIGKTMNLSEFAKVLVLDTFLGQADSRQAVFTRDRSRRELSFRAHFIDHGLVFGGSKWEISDLAGPSLYFDRKVYSMIDTAFNCEEGVQALASVSEDELRSTARDIPSEWLGPMDLDRLVQLFTILHKRRERIRTLISERLELLALNTLRQPNTFQSFPSDAVGF
jgi:hypothetical protein